MSSKPLYQASLSLGSERISFSFQRVLYGKCNHITIVTAKIASDSIKRTKRKKMAKS